MEKVEVEVEVDDEEFVDDDVGFETSPPSALCKSRGLRRRSRGESIVVAIFRGDLQDRNAAPATRYGASERRKAK